MLPEPLTPTQFIVILLSVTTLLLMAGYVIVKNWVNSVTKAIEAVGKYDERLRRLEAHDFHDLKGRVHTLMMDTTLDKKDLADYKVTNDGRIARAEASIATTEQTLDNLRVTLASIEAMVKDMWNRRRAGSDTP